MSRDFPGSAGNHLVVTNPVGALDITGDITVAAWIRPDALSGVQGIVTKENGVSFQYTLVTSGAQIIFRSGTPQANGAGSLTTGAWHHVAGTRDATNVRVYRDGSLDGSAAGGAGLDTSLDFVIGARSASGIPFDGRIAEVAVWNAALTAAEIAALAKGLSPQMVRRTRLAAHYPLWGNSSAGEPDLSGNGQHLTEIGTVGVGASPSVGPYVAE